MTNLVKICGRTANGALRPLGVRLVRRDALAVRGDDLRAALARVRAAGVTIGTIVDVGASDGKWSREARLAFPDATILAFEPLQERWEALDRWAVDSSGIHVVKAVAGSAVGEVSLDVADDLDGSSINDAPQNGRTVPVRTIDDEVARCGLDGPFLVKLDTHGYEVPIFAGAAATLERTEAIIVEVYNFRLTKNSLLFYEMCGHLDRLGFRCFDIFEVVRRAVDGALWQADFVFLKKDHPVFQRTNYR